MQSQRNFGLDLLRAIAITLVLVLHCTYFITSETHAPILLIIRTLGAIGVDLFFVLSGFLIGGLLLKQLHKGQTRFSHLLIFWKRRWFRTLPNYFLILCINCVLYFIFEGYFPESIWSYFVFLQNFTSPHPGFFTEAWSLSIEEYAYLILPFFLFAVICFFKKHTISLFLWATLVVIFFVFLLKVNFYLSSEINSYGDWSKAFRKVVIYRVDSIYIGFLLVYFVQQFPNFIKKYSMGFLLCSGALLIITHWLIYILQLQPQIHKAFYVFGYLPIISLCCAFVFPYALHMRSSTMIRNIIFFISTRSYAIYLINFSILLLTIQRFTKNFSFTSLQLVFLILSFIVTTLLFSNILYLFFEKPILKYRDRKIRL